MVNTTHKAMFWLGPVAALSIAACDRGDEASPTVSDAPAALDARQILIRASLDVRGARPSKAELVQLQASPAALDTMLAGFVDDPGFGGRIRSIFADAVRTRRDFYRFGAEDLGLPEQQTGTLNRAMAEETLNIISHVVQEDQPFSNILTADYTIVAALLLDVWPLAAAEEQPRNLPPGTVLARYTDARPAAGVLATNSFFWRHTSTIENANRGRSNAISRAFLCEDYLDRPIDFPRNVDLTNEQALQNAIRTNPGCQACHATLDPFASHLWGFMYTSDDSPDDWIRYHPENEPLWKDETTATPAFFGAPTDGTLSALAASIASDERFVACTVRRVYESFLGRDATIDDTGQLAAHREAFLASGLSVKDLVRSLLGDPAYRGRTELSAYGATPAPVTLKLASPELLSSEIRELSGYRMTIGGLDITGIDYGVRTLAGGSERGFAATPSLGHALVQRRLAESSALALMGEEPDESPSRLGDVLRSTDTAVRPTAAVVVELIAQARTRMVSEDSAEVTALVDLWNAIDNSAGEAQAWAGMLTALLADPDLAVY